MPAADSLGQGNRCRAGSTQGALAVDLQRRMLFTHSFQQVAQFAISCGWAFDADTGLQVTAGFTPELGPQAKSPQRQ